MTTIKPCCGNYEQCIEPCTPRGQWMATEALLNKKDLQFYFDGIPETKHTSPPKREWVGYTNEDRERIVPVLVQSLLNHDDKTMAVLLKAILIDIEQQLKEKNGG